jgi:hypothetical protein
MNRFIIFAIVLLNWPSPCLGQTNKPSQDRGNPYNANAQIVNPDGPSEPKGRQKAIDGQTEKTDDQSSSNWYLVGLTLALVLVGCAQVYVYFKQSSLMQLAINHSRDSSERGLRAYVATLHRSPDGNSLIEEETKYFPKSMYQWFIRNSGQTPAHNVAAKLQWTYITSPNANWPNEVSYRGSGFADADLRSSIATIGNGETVTITQFLKPQSDGTTFSTALSEMKAGRWTIFFYGEFVYRDIFDSRRSTTVCRCTRIIDQTEYAIISYHDYNKAE